MIPQIPSSIVFVIVVILLLLFIHKYNLLKTKYKNIIDLENHKKKKKDELQLKIQQNSEIDKIILKNQEILKNIKQKIAIYNRDLILIDYEIPKLRFDSIDLSLEDIYKKIESLQKAQMDMIIQGNVVVVNTDKIYPELKAVNTRILGEKNNINKETSPNIELLAKDYGLLMIKYFNSEAEFILSKIEDDNFFIIKKKIEDKFNNATQKKYIEKDLILLNSAYLNLKIKEAELRFNLYNKLNKSEINKLI